MYLIVSSSFRNAAFGSFCFASLLANEADLLSLSTAAFPAFVLPSLLIEAQGGGLFATSPFANAMAFCIAPIQSVSSSWIQYYTRLREKPKITQLEGFSDT
jgi:hypothetical protein